MGSKEATIFFKSSDTKACLHANKNNLAMKETLVMQYKRRFITTVGKREENLEHKWRGQA